MASQNGQAGAVLTPFMASHPEAAAAGAGIQLANTQQQRPPHWPEQPPPLQDQQQHQPAASSSGSLHQDEQLVLTPSKLRLDSRVMALHAITMWLGNMVFGILLLLKLGERLHCSWWLVFAPQWIGHAVHISTQSALIAAVELQVYMQLGPPPPRTGSMAMHMQYSMLRQLRTRSHIVDCISSSIDSAAQLAVKVVVCWLLDNRSIASSTVCWRLVLMPLWISWALTTVLTCIKHAPERLFGQLRDLLYIFAVFVAFKLDGLAAYSWQVVFMVPWMWFGALIITAIGIACMLVAARAWRPPHVMLLPTSFMLLLLSAAVQLISCLYLVKRLNGDERISLQAILLPSIVSWGAMGFSGLCVAWGLAAKERVRRGLAASGAVWTLREDVAARMTNDREVAYEAVRALTDEQVTALVEQLMQDKSKPSQLLKVGSTLYRRITLSTQLPDGIATSELTCQVAEHTAAALATGASTAGASAVSATSMQHLLAQPQGCKAAGKLLAKGMGLCGDEWCNEDEELIGTRPVVELHRQAAESHEEVHLGAGSCSTADGDAETAAATFVEVRVICRSPLPGMSHHSDIVSTTNNAATAGSYGPASHTGCEASTAHGSSQAAAGSSCSGAACLVTCLPATCSCSNQSRCSWAAAVCPIREDCTAGARSCMAAAGSCTGAAIGNSLVRKVSAALSDGDSATCCICYEAPASCVLLECGHGGFCRRCAQLLFVRPPNECPQCRSKIEQVVEIEAPGTTHIGEVARIKL